MNFVFYLNINLFFIIGNQKMLSLYEDIKKRMKKKKLCIPNY